MCKFLGNFIFKCHQEDNLPIHNSMLSMAVEQQWLTNAEIQSSNKRSTSEMNKARDMLMKNWLVEHYIYCKTILGCCIYLFGGSVWRSLSIHEKHKKDKRVSKWDKNSPLFLTSDFFIDQHVDIDVFFDMESKDCFETEVYKYVEHMTEQHPNLKIKMVKPLGKYQHAILYVETRWHPLAPIVKFSVDLVGPNSRMLFPDIAETQLAITPCGRMHVLCRSFYDNGKQKRMSDWQKEFKPLEYDHTLPIAAGGGNWDQVFAARLVQNISNHVCNVIFIGFERWYASLVKAGIVRNMKHHDYICYLRRLLKRACKMIDAGFVVKGFCNNSGRFLLCQCCPKKTSYGGRMTLGMKDEMTSYVFHGDEIHSTNFDGESEVWNIRPYGDYDTYNVPVYQCGNCLHWNELSDKCHVIL